MDRAAPAAGHNAGPVRDLRQWLDRLEETGRLAVARPGMALRFELAALAKRLDGTQATLFPRPDGHAIAVVSGLVSDRAWIAEAMGVAEAAMLAVSRRRRWHRWHRSTVSRAPCRRWCIKTSISRGCCRSRRINEHDSGPYITAGLVITRNPATGAQNVSINRLQLTGPDRLGVLLLPRHTYHFQALAEERGEALEVAIVIGVDPLTLLGVAGDRCRSIATSSTSPARCTARRSRW